MMKRVLVTVFLSFLLCGITFSQTGGDKRAAFQFSFMPFMSTNGLQAKEYTNGVSFNLLSGLSKNENVFAFAGLTHIILNDAKGFQFAGLGNYVGNDGKGMMFAGLGNWVQKEYRGFQFAGLGNYTGSDGKGMQFAGLINISKNYSGFQFAGLVNIAKKVKGVQFAGLLNIAESSDWPVALVNIIKDGELGVALTYNEIGSVVVALRSGGKYTYGIVGIGYNHKAEGHSFVTTGGFGAHIHLTPWLMFNNELTGETLDNFSKYVTFKLGYAFLPAFRINPHFELFGGPSINYMQTDDPRNTNILPDKYIWRKYGDSKFQQVYLGYQVGVQYIF